MGGRLAAVARGQRESYYCNTIPTPDGGTHEAGLRAALTKGIRAFGELVGQKKAKDITADDVFNGVELMLSVFIRNPHFQSQTKDRLTSLEAARFVEAAVRDHFDHYPRRQYGPRPRACSGAILERMDERLKRRAEREVKRKTATSRAQAAPPRQAHRLRRSTMPTGTELFIVEGDSAGGIGQAGAQPQDPGDPADPRQDPQRRLAPPPTRSAPTRKSPTSSSRSAAALRDKFDEDALRYERIIIMTDADVDGAHIATLLMTFFFQEMPELVRRGHLFLAQPPLYRLTSGAKIALRPRRRPPRRARGHRIQGQEGRGRPLQGPRRNEPQPVEGNHHGPGDAARCSGSRCPPNIEDRQPVKDLVERLMGKDPAHRFNFIQANAANLSEDEIDA